MRLFVAALAALLTLSLADSALAFQRGACVYSTRAAVAAETSVVEIQTLAAASGGKGIYLHRIETDTVGAYGFTIGLTTFIDSNTEVVTPTFIFGPGAVALTSIVRDGTDSGAALPGQGTYRPQTSSFGNGVSGLPFPVYVPAGRFVSVRRTTVNTTANVAICWTEVQ